MGGGGGGGGGRRKGEVGEREGERGKYEIGGEKGM